MMNKVLDKITSAIHRFGSGGPAGALQPPAAGGDAVIASPTPDDEFGSSVIVLFAPHAPETRRTE
jgi:hypothetical protein